LTAQDCFFFGQAAVNVGFYARGVEWLEQSYSLAGNENNEIVHQDKITSFTQHAINMVYFNPKFANNQSLLLIKTNISYNIARSGSKSEQYSYSS